MLTPVLLEDQLGYIIQPQYHCDAHNKTHSMAANDFKLAHNTQRTHDLLKIGNHFVSSGWLKHNFNAWRCNDEYCYADSIRRYYTKDSLTVVSLTIQ